MQFEKTTLQPTVISNTSFIFYVDSYSTIQKFFRRKQYPKLSFKRNIFNPISSRKIQYQLNSNPTRNLRGAKNERLPGPNPTLKKQQLVSCPPNPRVKQDKTTQFRTLIFILLRLYFFKYIKISHMDVTHLLQVFRLQHLRLNPECHRMKKTVNENSFCKICLKIFLNSSIYFHALNEN